MNRRDVVAALLALGASSFAAAAQRRTTPARIAYLGFNSPDTVGYLIEALKRGMSELGYVEGKTVVYEFRWALSKAERLPDLAKELVLLKPDVIIGPGFSQARALQNATTTIPIVIAGVSDPVGQGLVKSLARPGGNLTGLSTLAADYSPKLLELLLTLAPKLSRVAILVGFDTGRTQPINLQTAAQTAGVNTLVVEIQTHAEIANAFARIVREGMEAIIVLPSTISQSQRRPIAEMAIKNRLPSVSTTREFPETGGLISYGSDMADQIQSVATYVDIILKGAKPSDLPIEQPRTLDLAINVKTAKALGLTIPKELLFRADRVIE